MKWSELEARVKFIISVLILVAILAAASSVYNWYRDNPIAAKTFTEAKDMKKAKNIQREKIKATVPIEVLKKDDAVKKLKIGDPIKSNPDIQIPATAEIPSYEGKTNVLAEWNTADGKIKINYEQEPLSFFGFKNDLEIYVEGGMNTNGNAEIGGGLQWDFARVANTNIGAVGELRGSQDDLIGFAGLRFTYHKRRN